MNIQHAVDPRILEEAGAVETAISAEADRQASDSVLLPSYAAAVKSLGDQRIEIDMLLAAGILAEANTGYLVLRPDAQLRNSDLAQQAQVVAAVERGDRSKLFRKMAGEHWSDGLTPRLAGAYYARQRLEYLPANSWAQLPERGPLYLNFLTTELATRLGAEALPSAWVKIP